MLVPLESVTLGHARQASSTYARFDRLDIASGGRQRPSHFHPIVDTHPHTHTPIFSTQSSLVVTHAYAVGTDLGRHRGIGNCATPLTFKSKARVSVLSSAPEVESMMLRGSFHELDRS